MTPNVTKPSYGIEIFRHSSGSIDTRIGLFTAAVMVIRLPLVSQTKGGFNGKRGRNTQRNGSVLQ